MQMHGIGHVYVFDHVQVSAQPAEIGTSCLHQDIDLSMLEPSDVLRHQHGFPDNQMRRIGADSKVHDCKELMRCRSKCDTCQWLKACQRLPRPGRGQKFDRYDRPVQLGQLGKFITTVREREQCADACKPLVEGIACFEEVTQDEHLQAVPGWKIPGDLMRIQLRGLSVNTNEAELKGRGLSLITYDLIEQVEQPFPRYFQLFREHDQLVRLPLQVTEFTPLLSL